MPTLFDLACAPFWIWIESIQIIIETIEAASHPGWPPHPDADMRIGWLFAGW